MNKCECGVIDGEGGRSLNRVKKMKASSTQFRILALSTVLLLSMGCSGGSTAPEATATQAVIPDEARDDFATAEARWGLTEQEFASLSSLEQMDDYPLYTMSFYGAYGEPDFNPPTSGTSDAEFARPSSDPNEWGCSLFAALADPEHMVYGRNFDWYFSPALLLFTDPPDGYASVSMVDIAYLGFEDPEDFPLTDLPLGELDSLLSAPHWPFDGFNDQGLAVAIAAVPPGDMPSDPSKPTTSSLGAIRLILDHAKDVAEAVAILENHNIEFAGGPPVHYLIADRSSGSVLVEFYQGEMVVFPSERPWHAATNFLLAEADDQTEGQCWRYDLMATTMGETGGSMNLPTAMDLLEEVSQDFTQWSIVYEISSGSIGVVMGRHYDQVHKFRLPLSSE